MVAETSSLCHSRLAVLKQGIQRLILDSRRDENATRVAVQQVIDSGPALHLADDSGDLEAERLAREVIAAALAVHQELGPGLLPSAYEEYLCHELHLRRVPFERRRALELEYNGVLLPQGDEINLLVGDRVVVSPRALAGIEPLHEAELLSQLRLGGWCLALLINFNTVHLVEGLRRIVCTRRRLQIKVRMPDCAGLKLRRTRE